MVLFIDFVCDCNSAVGRLQRSAMERGWAKRLPWVRKIGIVRDVGGRKKTPYCKGISVPEIALSRHTWDVRCSLRQ
jgi:hypothetical protein